MNDKSSSLNLRVFRQFTKLSLESKLNERSSFNQDKALQSPAIIYPQPLDRSLLLGMPSVPPNLVPALTERESAKERGAERHRNVIC